jgi:hypothetical protein
MSTNVFPHIYEEMIDQDIKWLDENLKEDAHKGGLEYGHIIAIFRDSAKEYRERGYDEAMARRM